MPGEIKKEIALEIAHVLFIDIVGYTKLLINKQGELLQQLNQVVRAAEAFRAAEAAGKLIRLQCSRRSRAIPPVEAHWHDLRKSAVSHVASLHGR